MIEKRILYNINKGILYLDKEFNIVKASKYAAELAGYKEPDKIINKKFYEVYFFRNKKFNKHTIKKALRENKFKEDDIIYIYKDKYYSMNLVNDLDENNNILGLIITFDVVNEITNKRNKVEKIAYYDELTTLYNRNALYINIDNKINYGLENWAIIMIDLDDFKSVNDKLGHDLGDKFLKAFADRLCDVVKDEGIVGRLGGDEFLIIIDGDVNTTELIINKLYERLDDSIEFGWNNIFASCSMGIAFFPKDADNRSDLLKFADLALYHSKKIGKNIHSYYNIEISTAFQRKQKIIETLRTVIIDDKECLEIYYQPIVDINTGKIKKIEALSRINNNVLKNIPISEFINVAEETGLIIELGDIILEKIHKDIDYWNKKGFSYFDISINLSVIQLKNKKLIRRIIDLSNIYNVNKKRISLEITETAFLENLDTIKDSLLKLYKLGYSFSVDDFGTGYSSIDYIVNLPINGIKIDKNYIDRLSEKNVIAFLKTIKYFAFLTNKIVIIEGVEDKEQFEILKNMGFDFVQGYYFYEPMKRQDLDKFLCRDKLEIG